MVFSGGAVYMTEEIRILNTRGGWSSFAKDLSWFEKKVPPLPKPTGKVVYVTNTEELYKAVRNLEPYTTVVLKEGTYKLTDTIVLDKEGVTLRGESDDRRKVVLEGFGFYYPDDKAQINAIIIQCATDITVANLTITEFNVHGISVQGWSDPTPHRVHIYNVGFMNVGHQNIKVNPGVDRPAPEGGIVEYCYFEQTKRIYMGRRDSKGGDYTGGFDAHKIKDWIVRENVIINIQGSKGGADAGIFIWNHSSGNIIEKNLIIGCDKGIAVGNPFIGHFASYPEGSEKYHCKGGIIRNNFVYSYYNMPGIEAYAAPGVKIYNNTVVNEDTGCQRAIQYGHETTGIEIKNNLVGGYIRSSVKCTGEEPVVENNIVGASLDWFRNPFNGDLRLTEKAQASGKGVKLTEVTDDFYGNGRREPCTIGAQEV